MSTLEFFALSVALGADLFSVAVPIGMNKLRRRLIVKAAAVFALFHIGMILLGYYAGEGVCRLVEHLGTYHFDCPASLLEKLAQGIGAFVLAVLGFEMIADYFKPDSRGSGSKLLQGKALLLVAASVSVDALAAGFSLGMLAVDLWRLSGILGLVIFIIAITGLGLGRKIGSRLDGKSELAGGALLLLLALHLLYSACLA
ncbi:MAG: manganese efflux pump [Sporomusaceae bacterium]|nr:manganese efflux pump [Sporomusaceae bacterium]